MDSELSLPSSPSSSIGSDIDSVPSLKSHWTLDHLENMGVVYADKTSTLTDLMTRIKSSAEVKDDMKSIPRLCEVLMEFCRDLWTISYDFRNQSWMEAKEKITEVNALKANFKSREKEMMKIVKKRLGVDNNRHFFAWCWHTLEFWQYFGDLLARFKKPCQGEKRFTYLFMAFSKMFFLRPEGGKAYRSYLGIKDAAVMGNPDIRYMMPRKEEIGEKLFIVTEAKNYDAFRGNFSADTFSFKNISSNVLGQHGIELLIERKESHLFPGVLGLMCIGTQIIFTFLTVTNDQFDDILNGVGNKTQTSSIIYTRPYDYMDEADRNELMEPLFWLGYIQSLGYNIYGSAQKLNLIVTFFGRRLTGGQLTILNIIIFSCGDMTVSDVTSCSCINDVVASIQDVGSFLHKGEKRNLWLLQKNAQYFKQTRRLWMLSEYYMYVKTLSRKGQSKVPCCTACYVNIIRNFTIAHPKGHWVDKFCAEIDH